MKKIFFVLGLFLVPILALVTACGSKSSPSSPAAATATATPTPNVSTLAIFSGYGGNPPTMDQMIVDSSGNVYAADDDNGLIWKVTSAGVTSIFASSVGEAVGLAVDSSGNFYTVASSTSIAKITPLGSMTTGTIPTGSLAGVSELAVNSAGTTLYVTEQSNNYVVTVNLLTWTVANLVSIPSAAGIAIDSAGNLYVTSSSGGRVYKIAAGTSTATVLAGNGTQGYAIGANASAEFANPIGIAVDTTGHVYVACHNSYVIQEIYSGDTSLFAGTPGTPGYVNAAALSSEFAGPSAVAEDTSGNLYVWDFGYSAIRKIVP